MSLSSVTTVSWLVSTPVPHKGFNLWSCRFFSCSRRRLVMYRMFFPFRDRLFAYVLLAASQNLVSLNVTRWNVSLVSRDNKNVGVLGLLETMCGLSPLQWVMNEWL